MQHDVISSRIRSINDVRILDWVSEVCECDYPDFSEAASLKADTIADIDTLHHNVQTWKDAVKPENGRDGSGASGVETAIAGLEDVTITELEHKLSTYLLRAKEERSVKETTSDKNDLSKSIEPPKATVQIGTSDYLETEKDRIKPYFNPRPLSDYML